MPKRVDPNAKWHKEPIPPGPAQAGWRPRQWAADTGVSLSITNQLLKAGVLEFVKVGSATIIKTSPKEYLDGLPSKRGFTAEETAAATARARTRRRGSEDQPDPPPLAA